MFQRQKQTVSEVEAGRVVTEVSAREEAFRVTLLGSLWGEVPEACDAALRGIACGAKNSIQW